MHTEYVIRLINVSKKFRIYYDKGTSLKEKILFQNRNKYEERVILDGINMDIKKGSAIGLIGKNGCGKSTTLKLINKIMYPDEGQIVINGRISSLIELGAGFHPDMTGRENIYTNAAIFGLKRKEIESRLENIISFSELKEYIDSPVRTYSSGMYMRLAFSVAINVDADILLIDEILAVGDSNFQAKCFNKLREIKAKGTTIVIVSHSLAQIEQICDLSIWLDKGHICMQGKPREVHPVYMDFMGGKREASSLPVKKVDKSRWGNGKARITSIKSFNNKGEQTTVFKTGEAIHLHLAFEVSERVPDAVFGIAIFRNDGLQCYGTNTKLDKLNKFDLVKDGYTEIVIERNMLLPGEYSFDFAIESGFGEPVDYFTKAYKIDVFSEYQDVGIVRLEHEWRINDEATN